MVTPLPKRHLREPHPGKSHQASKHRHSRHPSVNTLSAAVTEKVFSNNSSDLRELFSCNECWPHTKPGGVVGEDPQHPPIQNHKNLDQLK